MNPEPVVTITLAPSEVNLVLQGLAELPFKYVAGLCFRIKEQADAQLAPPPPPTEVERKLELCP